MSRSLFSLFNLFTVKTSTMCHPNQKAITELGNNERLLGYRTNIGIQFGHRLPKNVAGGLWKSCKSSRLVCGKVLPKFAFFTPILALYFNSYFVSRLQECFLILQEMSLLLNSVNRS